MKFLVGIFKMLNTKCTYWVTADAVYLIFFPPGRQNWGSVLVQSSSTKKWYLPPRHGQLGGEAVVSHVCQEEEVPLKLRESCCWGAVDRWCSEIVWVFLHRKKNLPFIFLRKECRLQTAWVLAGLGFFLVKRGVKGSKIFLNASYSF